MQFIIAAFLTSLSLVSADTIFDIKGKMRPIAIGPFTAGCEITCGVRETFALNGKCYCGDNAITIVKCLEKINMQWPLIHSSNKYIDPDTVNQANSCVKGPDGKELRWLGDVYQLGDIYN